MKDIGIDLGTANVLIYVKGNGIVLNEPSVVAVDTETKNVLAVGTEASEMLGRTPGKVKAIKPLKDGVIADFEYTEVMLNNFIKRIKGRGILSRPRILICCPSNITAVEKNAIKEAAERLGARKVFVEEEPKVAAIGAGMDISKPSGNMVIDIGGGTTDIAVLSLGGIVTSQSLKVAGNSFDLAIIDYVKDKHKLLIGDRRVLYKYGPYVNRVAAINKGLDESVVVNVYNSLPIKAKGDINISAKKIMEILSMPPGKYLNKIYIDLENKIIDGLLVNDNKNIESYIINNYRGKL